MKSFSYSISDFHLMILGLLAKQNAEGSAKLHSTYPEEHFGKKLTKKISTLLFFSRKISDIWRDILSWMSKLPSTCPEEKHIEVTEIWENRIFFSFFGIRSECFKLLHENCEQSLQTAFDLSNWPIRGNFFLEKFCIFIFTGLRVKRFGFFCEEFI